MRNRTTDGLREEAKLHIAAIDRALYIVAYNDGWSLDFKRQAFIELKRSIARLQANIDNIEIDIEFDDATDHGTDDPDDPNDFNFINLRR